MYRRNWNGEKFDIDMKEIEEIIKNTDGKREEKIDWTSAFLL